MVNTRPSTLLLAGLAGFALTAAAVAADDDRGRRVKVALALSAAGRAEPGPVAVAPEPHPAVPAEMPGRKLPYGDAYALAVRERKPLVVFVGCSAEVPPGAVGTELDRFAEVPRGKAAVTVPRGGGLVLDATVGCEGPDLRAAVKAAAGKVETAPAAPKAPPPLDWQIRAAPAAAPTYSPVPVLFPPACDTGRA